MHHEPSTNDVMLDVGRAWGVLVYMINNVEGCIQKQRGRGGGIKMPPKA